MVANRLSEDARARVLLLEAGGYENWQSEIPIMASRLQMSAQDWKYYTEPQRHSCFALKENRSRWPRGKVLGGSSTLNYMLYVRGNRRDYDLWARLGNPGWSWDEVFPYFVKSEDNRDPDILANGYHGEFGRPAVGRARKRSPQTTDRRAPPPAPNPKATEVR